MTIEKGWRAVRRAAGMLALLIGFAATPALACDVASASSTAIGSYSPAALQAKAVPYLRASGGFSCTSDSVVTLLGGNYLKATVAGDAVLTLASTSSSDTVVIRLAADKGGTMPLTPGVTVTYMQNTTFNVLGLLGSDMQDMPLYVKPSTTVPIAAGTYTGSVSVRWDWSFCKGVNAAGACLLGNDTGSKSGVVKFTLTVAARPATMTVASSTTWDPVNTTSAPKAIPGSKLRLAITLSNPDLVAIDADTLKVALPTATRLVVALDGDGSGSGGVVQSSQGTTPSTLTLAYAGPSSAADDVEFSSDGGLSWGYAPVAGDAASQAAVTGIRFRPKGSMAPGSSFTISVPYSVK